MKAKIGETQIPSPTLPLGVPGVELDKVPQLVLGRRIVKRRNVAEPQVLVQWRNQTRDDATWEDYEEMMRKFPDFIREDTNFLKEGELRREIADLGMTVEANGLNEGEEEKLGKKVKKNGQLPISNSKSDSGTQGASIMLGNNKISVVDKVGTSVQKKRCKSSATGEEN